MSSTWQVQNNPTYPCLQLPSMFSSEPVDASVQSRQLPRAGHVVASFQGSPWPPTLCSSGETAQEPKANGGARPSPALLSQPAGGVGWRWGSSPSRSQSGGLEPCVPGAQPGPPPACLSSALGVPRRQSRHGWGLHTFSPINRQEKLGPLPAAALDHRRGSRMGWWGKGAGAYQAADTWAGAEVGVITYHSVNQ